ncbi:MAG: restriction endonuclease subunit S [Chloroflexi bacterium HGW-Chloroflexi-6]|nr:MAG: restriction endonuclease subunit S [Chloroflexi bacterium HGW-Chloroflexi-6]
MKPGWKVEKLGDVCDFFNGLWTGKKPPFINVGVIRNTNFTKDCELDDSDIVYLDVEQAQFRKRSLQYGDIILEKSGGGPKQPVGRVVIFNKEIGDFSFSNFTSAIRIKDKSRLDFRFLHRYLFSAYVSGVTEKMQSHSTGIRNLKFDEYKQIPVPIPPLPEQQRIVAVLDEAFASIAQVKTNVERNLVNARELFESVLRGTFTGSKSEKWQIKKLGDVCSLITDGKHGDSENESNSGYYFLSAKNVKDGTLSYDDAREITRKDFEETHRRTNLMPFDICMVNTGATIGKIALAPDDPKTFRTTFQKSVAIIKPIPSIVENTFCCYHLKSDLAKLVKVSSGSAQKNLLIGDMKDHLVRIPPLAEQRVIVERLDALSAETVRLEAVYRQKVAALEELKKSVLQRAFEGSL